MRASWDIDGRIFELYIQESEDKQMDIRSAFVDRLPVVHIEEFDYMFDQAIKVFPCQESSSYPA